MGCCIGDKPTKRVVGENAAGLCCTDVLFAVLFLANLIPIFYLFGEFQADNDIAEHLNSSFAIATQEEFGDDMALAAMAGGYEGTKQQAGWAPR